MRARLVPFEGDVTPTPEAQVGFRLDGEDQFNYLTERELTPERVAPYSHSTRLVEIKLISARGAGFTELLRRLSLLGIQFEERYRSFDQGMEEPGETIKIQYDFEIDNDLLRAVSKIGFNYAAFVLGADAVRSKEFDAARDFIRRGEALVPLVGLHHQPVLDGPNAEGVHSCGLFWGDNVGLVAMVGLFNEVAYRIRLCGRQHLRYAQLRDRHAFHPKEHAIIPLT